MKNFFAIYVPSTINGNKPALQLQATVVDEVAFKMADLFGGFTIHDAIGGYILADRTLVKESVKIVKSYTDDVYKYSQVKDLAHYIGEKMGQETVAIETEKELNLISIVLSIKAAA